MRNLKHRKRLSLETLETRSLETRKDKPQKKRTENCIQK